MADSRLHINTGIDMSGMPGARPLYGPFPSLGGSLFAAYALGTDYAQYADAPDEALIYGAGYDWSGNGRHIVNWNEGTTKIHETYFECAVYGTTPEIPIAPEDLLVANDAISIVALSFHPATAKTVAITRNGIPDPAIALTIAPQTADARASVSNGGTVSAQIGTLTGELGANALYAGTYTDALRNVYSKTGVEATKTASEATAKTIAGSNHFELGDEASTGTGVSKILMLSFYDRVITQAEFEADLLRKRAWYTALGIAETV